MMGWSVSNWGTIVAGASGISIGFGWPGSGDQGPVWSDATPQNPNATLVTSNYFKEQDSQGNIWYGFDLANVGSSDTVFTLEGGTP
jgi:hypothetical protein